jgi:hypothetical protein
VTKRNVEGNPCVDVELMRDVSLSIFFEAALDNHGHNHPLQSRLGRAIRQLTHTLLPDKTTLLPSRIALYSEDLGQCTVKLFFLVRCSSLLDLDWEALMPSAAPKTAPNAMIAPTTMARYKV